MTGRVDEHRQAGILLTLRHPVTDIGLDVDAWIDTGFTGELNLPFQEISTLGLTRTSEALAALADGSRLRCDTYECVLEWFGHRRPLQVLAISSGTALLGAGLLERCVLTIDYPAKTVLIEERPPGHVSLPLPFLEDG